MTPPREKEKIFNVPNALSFYRLIISPLILYLVITGAEKPFIILICISLVTDILDGYIARRFNLVTRIGGQIDNMADLATYMLAVYGLYRFRWEEVSPHAWLLYLFFAVFFLSYFIGWIKFRKMPGLHLYGAVVAAYLQGFFLFFVFAAGFWHWLYFLALGWGTLAYLEKCFVLLTIDEIAPGSKGLYWVLKKKRIASTDSKITDDGN
jgi:CDP-diacylglycerol--glycerol-3-phosphate 3-phosphatidyltransferase